MASQVLSRTWSYLLLTIIFIDIHVFALSSESTTTNHAVMVTGTKISIINGLLGPASSKLEARQQLVCPFSGDTLCSGTDFCCPAGSFCQPLNPIPMACCISATGMSCNGGTACCSRATEQCCNSSTGCCLLTSNIPPPTLTTNSLPQPTSTSPTSSLPKGTIALDYQDMLKPRPNEPASSDRVGAVNSLFKNMCLGMQKGGTLSSQSATFMYAPSQQSSNRNAVCGSVTCGSGQTCDEFPFASTTLGGSKNTAGTCVDTVAMSIQAAILGSFFDNNNVSANDNYIIRLSNVDCTSLLSSGTTMTARNEQATDNANVLLSGRNARLAKRQAPSGLTAQMQPIQLLEFSPFSEFDIFNHSVYYLGSLAAAQYTVNVQVTEGIVDALHVVDYQGLSYANSGNNLLLGIIDPPFSLSFTVPQNAVGVTLVVDTVIDYKISASIIAGPGGGVVSSLSSAPSGASLSSGPVTTPGPGSGSGMGPKPPGTVGGGGAIPQRGTSFGFVSCCVALLVVFLSA